MLATRPGLVLAREKLEGLQADIVSRQLMDAEDYKNAGDDWHDNPVWQQGRQETEALSRRVVELEQEINMCSGFIEDQEYDYTTVQLGAIARVQFKDQGVEVELILLSPLDKDRDDRVITTDAPMGRELVGKKIGDIISVNNRKVEIISIARWDGLDISIPVEE